MNSRSLSPIHKKFQIEYVV